MPSLHIRSAHEDAAMPQMQYGTSSLFGFFWIKRTLVSPCSIERVLNENKARSLGSAKGEYRETFIHNDAFHALSLIDGHREIDADPDK